MTDDERSADSNDSFDGGGKKKDRAEVRLRSSMRKPRATITELEQHELVAFHERMGQVPTRVVRKRRSSLSEMSCASIGEEETQWGNEDDDEEKEEEQPPVMMQYFLFLMFWAFFTNLFAKFKMPFARSQQTILGEGGEGSSERTPGGSGGGGGGGGAMRGRRRSVPNSPMSSRENSPSAPPKRMRRVSWVDERDMPGISEEKEQSR